MKKVVVWGLGQGFDRCIDRLRYFEEIKEIKIVGVTSDEKIYKKVYGYEFVPKKTLMTDIDYDILLKTGSWKGSEIYSRGGG